MTYRAKKQRGVALLLALGFLSLLLVMGIAFVTNATVARKTAANSRARAQASASTFPRLSSSRTATSAPLSARPKTRISLSLHSTAPSVNSETGLSMLQASKSR